MILLRVCIQTLQLGDREVLGYSIRMFCVQCLNSIKYTEDSVDGNIDVNVEGLLDKLVKDSEQKEVTSNCKETENMVRVMSEEAS